MRTERAYYEEGMRYEEIASTIPASVNVTRYLHAVEEGEPGAAEELLPLVYEDLRRHAAVRMAGEPVQHTLQPTALVHEAWLRLVERGRRWENRAHFFGAAAQTMRCILIDTARRKARLKNGGLLERVNIDKVSLVARTPEEKVLLINDALELLEREYPEKAQVVILKYFGGHSNREVAEMMNLCERTIERHWAYAKAWLYQMIQSNPDYRI